MNAVQHDVCINGSLEDIFSAFTTRKELNAWRAKEAAGAPEWRRVSFIEGSE